MPTMSIEPLVRAQHLLVASQDSASGATQQLVLAAPGAGKALVLKKVLHFALNGGAAASATITITQGGGAKTVKVLAGPMGKVELELNLVADENTAVTVDAAAVSAQVTHLALFHWVTNAP